MLGLIITIAFTGAASAGDWQWGCMGPMGDEQILFSRYTLVIAPPSRRSANWTIYSGSPTFPKNSRNAEAYNAD